MCLFSIKNGNTKSERLKNLNNDFILYNHVLEGKKKKNNKRRKEIRGSHTFEAFSKI